MCALLWGNIPTLRICSLVIRDGERLEQMGLGFSAVKAGSAERSLAAAAVQMSLFDDVAGGGADGCCGERRG